MDTRKKMLIGLGAVAVAASLGVAAIAQGNQPHMTRAIEDLQAARAELNAAERDKGGHRTTAVGLIDQAIGEVRAGMAVANGY
jgi:hypothetical protein